MTTGKARRALNQRLKSYVQPSREVAVYMGDASGVVAVAGRPGYIYVRDARGNVSIVWNTTVPNIVNQPVFVAYLDGRIQVVRVRDVFLTSKPSNVGPHSWSHEWTESGGDVVRVFDMQIMPWKAYPNADDAFTVDVYRAVYDAAGTWIVDTIDEIDLNAHVPGSSNNGCYVLLSIDDTGVINHTVGSNVDPYTNLDIEDIPAIPTDEKPLWAIRLYYNQTGIHQIPTDNDFIDLRDSMHSVGGGGGTVATGAELDTGTNNTKFASALALKNSHNVPSVVPSTAGKVMTSDGTDWISATPGAGAGVATGAEIDTGTNDTKFASPKALSDSHNVPSVAPGTTGKVMTSDGTDWISSTPATIPVKATAAELDTGTDDAKFATALGIKDAHNVPSVVPSTSGNVLTSNGTDWISSTPAAVPVKATAAELDTGTDDAKFATALGIKDAHNIPNVVPSTSGNILTSNGTDWISSAPTGGGTVATGAELDTGTDNAKFASALALANSHYIPTVSPATSGNVLTSNGTDWVSSTPSGGTKASAAEVDTGTDDAKFVTPKSIADSHNVPNVVPSTAGKLMTSDGTDWISVAPANVLFIDQAGGTSDTYGVLGGSRNGSNKVFTVSQAAYNSGTLRVFLNGQMLTQGSAEDWAETAPGSGTFTFDVAPLATDEITVVYGYQTISGIINEAPIDGIQYARKDAGWVSVSSNPAGSKLYTYANLS